MSSFSALAAPEMGMQGPLQVSPIGRKLVEKAIAWKVGQWNERVGYAKPARCAQNLSRVFSDAGMPQYSSDSVIGMLSKTREAIEQSGQGLYVQLPLNDSAGIRKALNRIYGGRLPVGAIVAGCNSPSCAKFGPNEHIAFVGHAEADGDVWLYHNNWLREGVDRATFGPYMVSERNLKAGFPRQWMATPWMNIKLESDGEGVVAAQRLLPQIDDLDPHQYHLTIVVVPEIDREIREAMRD